MDLKSKVVDCLVGAALSAVGAGTRAVLGVDVVFFLGVIAA